jgi:hypothetical protein
MVFSAGIVPLKMFRGAFLSTRRLMQASADAIAFSASPLLNKTHVALPEGFIQMLQP